MTITLDGTKGTTTPGLYSTTTFTGTYTDGIVVDYTTGTGRISVGSSDGLTIYNGGVASTALVTWDSAGNQGMGVTPSAWESGGRVIQMDLSNNGGTAGNTFNIWSRADSARLWTNAYFNGAAYVRQSANSIVPTNVSIDGTGGIVMQSAPSGSAGSTFTNGNITSFFSLKKDNTLALQGGTQSAGTGIAFPASQSASSDANTLDDYEEGSWTPNFYFVNGASAITTGNTGARYVKIGKQVTCWFYINCSSLNGGSGQAYVSGLPFTNSNNAGPSEGATMTPNYWANLSSSVVPGGYVQANSTTVLMVNISAGTSISGISASSLSATTNLYGNLTYYTA